MRLLVVGKDVGPRINLHGHVHCAHPLLNAMHVPPLQTCASAVTVHMTGGFDAESMNRRAANIACTGKVAADSVVARMLPRHAAVYGMH
jgi:hypothetical protein